MTYMEYYRDAYGIKIRNNKQPLLKSIKSVKKQIAKGGKKIEEIIPVDENKFFDMMAVIHEIIDEGSWCEIKQLFAQLEVGPITTEVRELTAATIARVRGTDEAREGFAAFLAKRPAHWIPR